MTVDCSELGEFVVPINTPDVRLAYSHPPDLNILSMFVIRAEESKQKLTYIL